MHQKVKKMKKSETKTKIVKFLVFLWVAVALLATPGCEKKDNPSPENNEYEEINDWILENMQVYYLWNTQIPKKTDKTLYPADYFESLLYRTEDKFSWIQENFIELMNYLSGINTEAGYEYGLFTEDNKLVYGFIAYIKPGTSAEKAGLKRGDFFSSINGTAMTMDNYQELLSKISQPHTLGIIDFTTGATRTVSLQVVVYAENPILLDTIYHIGNKKIGYFVYNFFARDSDPLGVAYEKELNDLFGKYNAEKIDDLIIDLRYNSGGAVSTAEVLSSMISNRTTTDIMGYMKYNALVDKELSNYYGKDYNVLFFPDNIDRYDKDDKLVEEIKINKMENLNKVHLIVTRNTASASELIVNCLKPYMPVVLIGDVTRGKNVGSITIYEEDEEKQKTNTWGMQPIILKLENKDHFSDYGKGFTPDVKVESEIERGMRELGDIDELMLSAALDHILGRSPLRKTSVTLDAQMVGSSIDRISVGKGMFFNPRFFRRTK